MAGLTYRMHKVGLLTDWRYRMLFVEIAKNGYRTNEPNSAPGESSQVLNKVFDALRGKSLSMGHVAESLLISTEELRKLVFGLVLTAIAGSENSVPVPGSAPRLKLVRPSTGKSPTRAN